MHLRFSSLSLSLLVAILPSIGLTTAAAQTISTDSAPSNIQHLAPYEAWQQSYDKAMELARTTDRPVMIVFSGSDWVPECRSLVQNIFLTHSFASWSTKNVVKLEIDFPRTYRLPDHVRQQNERLLEKYAAYIKSYPTILLIDKEGNVLSKLGIESVSAYRWIDAAEMSMPIKRNENDLSG